MFGTNLRRLVKYGIYGTVGIGGSVVALNYDGDYESLAIVRLTRSAYTAVDIGRVYQNMLYSKDWDRTSKEYYEVRSQAHKIGAEKLLALCQANKGVYIKVGQHVGALEYLLPNEYVSTMRILHSDAPKNTVEECYQVIREDWNKEPEEIFVEFDPEPLGTASLAQVHRAVLNDGTVVAVKVQHPFVRKNVAIDLHWMEFIITTMSKVFPEFQMQWLVDETKKNIAIELDFLNEGKNAEKVAEHFKDCNWLKIPKIHWEYSTERVLVMDYIKGGKVNDLKYIAEHNINKNQICRRIADLYSHMIFLSGFVHSDPHPGNILISKEPEDAEATVYLLDHGLYADLTENFRYHYSKLWLSILSRNREEMKIHSKELGISEELYGLFACIVSGRPWESIMKGIEKTKPSSEERTIFQDNLPDFLHHITQCLEQVDRQALLVLKTNDLVRSIEHTLGTHETMCGFMVMTKCCMKTTYDIDYKNSNSILMKQWITLKYTWSLFIYTLYRIYLNLYLANL